MVKMRMMKYNGTRGVLYWPGWIIVRCVDECCRLNMIDSPRLMCRVIKNGINH